MRRVPATLTLLAVSMILGLVTQGFWDAMQDRPLRDHVAYGVPAFQAGRWWTVFPGTFFASRPWQYLFLILGVVLLGGFAEWRLGTRRAVAVMVGGQLFGVVAAAVFLLVTGGHGWGWATDLSNDFGSGPGSAVVCAAAAASATIARPWRTRLRALLIAYPVVAVLYVGTLADVENVFAVFAGLVVGPILVGGRPRIHVPTLSRREFRWAAAGFLLLSAVGAVVAWLAPVSGPLSRTQSDEVQAESLSESQGLPWVLLIQVVLFLMLARGVYLGRRRSWRWAVGITVVFLVLLLLTAVSLAINSEPGWPSVIYQLLLTLGNLWVLVAGRHAFRNPSPRRARRGGATLLAEPTSDDREEARKLLSRLGTVNRLSWMTTWEENRWYHEPGHEGYVAYRVHAGVAIGLCDPVAATSEERSALFSGFADRAHHEGLVPCVFTVTAEAAANARALKWDTVKVAEEAVIPLDSLAFTGKKWQDIRTALNQAKKSSITYRVGPLGQMPRGVQTQVRAISEGWVGDKGLPEMGFTLGGVEESLDPNVRVGLAVDADTTVHGITSWLPMHMEGGQLAGWTLDVMRRLPDGFRYSMEFLIASACLNFKEEGYSSVSLSGAPLARSAPDPGSVGHGDPGPLDVFLRRLAETLEPYYGFQSLHSFKTKFQPAFEPLYLVFPDEAALPRIGIALTRAYLPDAGLRDLVSAARSGPD